MWRNKDLQAVTSTSSELVNHLSLNSRPSHSLNSELWMGEVGGGNMQIKSAKFSVQVPNYRCRDGIHLRFVEPILLAKFSHPGHANTNKAHQIKLR